ncbi:MAG TPA: CdaR family protein [bacterium]|jgi:YbbR domain-containing protein|nr:CdaR family protein [bacterium]
MDSWLQKDGVVRVVALMLAFVMWLFVINENNPQDTRTISVLPELRQLPAGMVLAEEVKPVSVRLRGRHNDLQAVAASEIDLYLDLSAAEEGEKDYPVQVTALPDNLQLVYLNPREVTVGLEAITQKELPVELVQRGNPTTGYAAGEPALSPVQVLLEGPRSRVDSANRAVVRLDLEGAQDNLRVSVPVQILDNKGAPAAEGLRIKPEVVEVALPVARLPAKIVSVEAQVTGEPAPGYQVAQVTADPDTVVVSGPPGVLAEVTSVSTLPLNIAGASSNQTEDVRIALPRDVRAEVEKVQVMVVIEQRTIQRTLDEIEIEVRDLDPELEAELEPSAIKATVSGLSQTISRLKAEDMTAYVSAADLAADEHQLAVTLELPSGVRQLELAPGQIKVTIKEKEDTG